MKNLSTMSLSQLQDIKFILTDIDDTLTSDGRLKSNAYEAMERLSDNGYSVIPVTGRCAGWCDHIAQLWPVDAVLGENGAFIMEKKNGYLTLRSDIPLPEVSANQSKLKEQVLAILSDYPELSLTLDQSYRLCEVAIDIGQNRPKVDDAIIEEIVSKIHALGAHATASSIHINAWYGEHSKKVTSTAFLKAKGLSDQEIVERSCYVGDSMNDQYMFEILPNSVGVANIQHYWERLEHHPSVVMTKPGGYGFSEFVDKLLALK